MEKPDINYENFSKELVICLGGKENIVSVSHCISRLRFVLKNYDLVDKSKLNGISLVRGSFKASGQYHIIIGSNVNSIYSKFLEYADLVNKGESIKEFKETAGKQGNWFQKSLNLLSSIFIPIVPILVAGGIILGIRNIFEANFDGWIMVEKSQFIKGLNDFLWIPAQVCFWWLPVAICYSIFKRMNADPVLGIVVGLTLLVPPLINTYETMASSSSNSPWIWDIIYSDIDKYTFNFGFMKYPWKIQYTAQVIPTIAIAILGAYINNWIRKVSPAYLLQILVPIVTILSSFIIGLFVIGPAGFVVGSAIAYVFKWAFTNYIAKYFFGIIIGLTYAPIVVTGLHHTFNAIFVQNTIVNGGNFLFIATCAQAIAQGSGSLAWCIINRKKENNNVKDIGIPSIVSSYLGVTEPSMYGINLKYMYPFIAACIGSAVATELAVIAGVTATNSGNGAWLGILNVQVQSKVNGVSTWAGTGYLWFMIAMILNVAVTIGIAYLLSRIPYFKKFNLDLKVSDTFMHNKKNKEVVMNGNK